MAEEKVDVKEEPLGEEPVKAANVVPPKEEPAKAEPKEEKAKAPEEKPKAEPKEAPEEEKPKETPKKEGKAKEKAKSKVVISDATPAQVVKVFRKVGLYGECYQVLVRVLEGRDKGNLLRRNVRGPVKENDMLMLKETERDVRAV